MAHKDQKIRQIGNSAGILLPADWLRSKGLKPGSSIQLEVTDQRISVFAAEAEREIEVDEKFARAVRGFFRRNQETLKRLAE